MSVIDHFIQPETIHTHRGALRILGIYLLTSAVWLLLSDSLLPSIAVSHKIAATLDGIIDGSFAIITGILLYELVRRETGAAQERETQIHLIADSMPAMIAYIGADRSYRFFNRAYRELFDAPAQLAEGKSMQELAGPETYSDRAGYVDQVLSGKRVTYDQTMADRKGVNHFYSVSLMPDLSADGQVKGFYSLRNDITERKQAEAEREALLAENQRQKALLDAIFEADPSCLAVLAGPDMKVVYANPAYRFLTPELALDPIGKPYAVVWPPQAGAGFHEQIQTVIKTGRPFKANNFERVFPDGTRRIFKFQGRRINWQGQQACLITLWDVTEQEEAQRMLSAELDLRRQAEAALAARTEEIKGMTQQLWQASKLATMGELAASVAHEINNPLAVLSLRVENLEGQLPDSSSGKKDIAIMGNEIERIAGIVSNLLQFSRSGTRHLSSLMITEEIAKTLELVHTHLINRHIDVQEEASPETPMIVADRQQMRQVFLNLITNASDAMPQGGTLKIGVRPSADGAQLVIEMQDTGVGILLEDLPRLTEPFFTTKPEGKGTGLGLAICRRIIEEHHGTFQITSQGKDQGATVRIALPQKNSPSSLAPEE